MTATFLLKTSILGLAGLINLLLALSVFRNNPRSATNRVYGLLSSVIFLWMLANYLSLVPELIDHSLTFIRLSLFFAVAMSAMFLFFAHTIPHEHLSTSRKQLLFYGSLTLITMLVVISPLAFSKLNIVNGAPSPVPGPGMGIFSLVSTIFSIMAVFILVRKLKRSKGVEKQQLRYVLYGIGMMLGLIIATVLIPVVLFKVSLFVDFLPLYTIVFLGLTTVAIIRHRLFDIRLVIARSVAYLLTIVTLGLLYTGVVFLLFFFLFNDASINVRRHLTYISLSLLFTPTVYWFKKFFDRLSNKVFFQDAYEPQLFLDQLNRSLVANVEIENLLLDSSQVIESNLKTEFCIFHIKEAHNTRGWLVGTKRLKPTEEDIRNIYDFVPPHPSRIIITNDLADTPEATKLHHTLTQIDVAVVVRLVAALKGNAEGIGYILLGPKKSGNAYSVQDVRVLNIIATELVIAVENALRFEEIENFNITLQQKVDEATRKLRQTNEKLKILDETKDEFISMASHQLRTPLTSVKGYLSMVLDGDTGKITAAQRTMLEQAFTSSQRMVYLIADLLNVSRLRTGKFVIESVPMNLADAILGEIEQLKETAASRGLELTYEKPANFPTLMLDETKIRQVIMNFTDNAIYYTPSGGHIKVELKDLGKSVEFTVTDNGIGVPKHEQHQLFNKFYRAGNARKARPDGTGLGLFMAKKVVVAQGGSIIFKSQEGKGSTFGFTFSKDKLLPSRH